MTTFVPILLVVALVSPPPVAAVVWPPFSDEVVSDLHGMTFLPTAPRLAWDATREALHVAWNTADTLWRAWREDGAWRVDTVGTHLELLDWTAGPGGRLAALALRPGAALVVLRLDPGGWRAETLLARPGWAMTGALALDAGDDPAVVLAAYPESGLEADLSYVRRQAGAWSVMVLDTSAHRMERPALALDAAGRPRIAYLDGGLRQVPSAPVRYLEGTSPHGPFIESLVDSAGTSEPALALDPATGEPRVAHEVRWGVLYRWRANRGWGARSMLCATCRGPMSLSIAPDGSVLLVATRYVPVAPMSSVDPGPSCGPSAMTGFVHVVQGITNDGSASFSFTTLHHPGGFDDRTGPRSGLALSLGHARVGWSTCDLPAPVLIASQDGTVDVAPDGPRQGPALTLAPNPLPAGRPLTVSFTLAAPAAAALELHDVAGRRVVRHDAGHLDAGAQVRAWDPGPLSPGLYWLSLRVDDARVARRTLVVAR